MEVKHYSASHKPQRAVIPEGKLPDCPARDDVQYNYRHAVPILRVGEGGIIRGTFNFLFRYHLFKFCNLCNFVTHDLLSFLVTYMTSEPAGGFARAKLLCSR